MVTMNEDDFWWESPVDSDSVCEHGESGICLECPVLMEEIREPGSGMGEFGILMLMSGLGIIILLLIAGRL